MTMKTADQRCPDCSQPLQRIWDYPENELWCLHCGNRYLAAVNPSDSELADPLVGFRVLLLDTSTDRRDQLVRRFTRCGYQVTPVCHHRQALEAASFRRFDVIVLPSNLADVDCDGFILQMKRLLGAVKFVLVDLGSRLEDAPRHDPDVVLAKVSASDYAQLEQVVEQLVDDAVAAHTHAPRASRQRLAASSAN